MIVDSSGRIDAARYVESDNCDARPPGETITLLVIHNISLPPGEFGGDGIERLFTNTLDCGAHPYYLTLTGVRVSAHFLIRRTGELLQFVPCTMRAWHAGVSAWRGRKACNDFSIGIELEGADAVPYADTQYSVLVELMRALRSAYPIIDIVGHSDIAPERKTDPGAAFDWVRVRDLIGR
ncbi:MAG: 1,6-anhydro-N-acetylmuramyl-L-alanine amidase AmpD [Burkholderiales bacterium]|nr:1,6-anhydro-N-acetylmuramyl-L-alanine amidase AmpD [Burkholderiales bacterium]